MNVLERKRGITLIALVITIITILILAGVSINSIIGKNGTRWQAQAKCPDYPCSQAKTK